MLSTAMNGRLHRMHLARFGTRLQPIHNLA